MPEYPDLSKRAGNPTSYIHSNYQQLMQLAEEDPEGAAQQVIGAAEAMVGHGLSAVNFKKLRMRFIKAAQRGAFGIQKAITDYLLGGIDPSLKVSSQTRFENPKTIGSVISEDPDMPLIEWTRELIAIKETAAEYGLIIIREQFGADSLEADSLEADSLGTDSLEADPLEQEQRYVLTVWSHTYYGRGGLAYACRDYDPAASSETDICYHEWAPVEGKQTRERVRVAQVVLDSIVPDKSIYGYSDEDYGWICPLTTAERAKILARHLPNRAQIDDEVEIEIRTGKHTRLVSIEEMSADHRQQITGKQPVGRDFKSLYRDWWDSYGSRSITVPDREETTFGNVSEPVRGEGR